SRPACSRGFSLVEILVMGMVLTIAMAIVVPLLGSSNYSMSLAGAMRMASDLQYAQDAAIATQKDITVTFDTSSEAYWLSNASGVLIHPITNSAYKTDFKTITELAHLDIVKTSGGRSVTFDPSGVPATGDKIVLRAGDSLFYVSISAVTGTVSVTAGE
ncbi:MAG: GspH/FimT family pseudopilin, partial [Phycisphaerae bacterium]|nr:GspH/FimT family pseudopilin [Phycisphaerae bacterium]